MPDHQLHREQLIPRPLHEVFPFFADAGNLEAITPRWLNFQILTARPIDMHVGALLEYRLKWHGLPIAWQTRIVAWDAPHCFADLQVRGPYRLWHHTHTFRAEGESTRMTDLVNYALPFGPLGALAHTIMVRRELELVFDYRCKVIESLFARK